MTPVEATQKRPGLPVSPIADVIRAWHALFNELPRSMAGWLVSSKSAWALAAAAIGNLSAMLLAVALSRSLGVQAYGALSVIQGTLSLLGSIAGSGFGLSSAKHVAEVRPTDPARAGRIVGVSAQLATVIGGLFALVLALLSPWVASTLLGESRLATPLRIGCAGLLFSVVNAEQLGALTGLEAFRAVAGITFCRGLATICFAIGGIHLFGLNGAIAGISAAAAVTCLLGACCVRLSCRRAGVPVRYVGNLREVAVIARFALPATIGGLVAPPVTWLGSVLLVRQPGGLTEMGLFGVATQWRAAIGFFPGVLYQVCLPRLAFLAGVCDYPGFRRAARAATALTVGSALGAASLVTLGADQILALHGRSFVVGHATFIVVVWTGVVMALDAAFGCIICSLGRMWPLAALTSLWGVLACTAAWLLVPALKAVGLGAAFMIAYAVEVCVRGAYVARLWRDPRSAAGSGGHAAAPRFAWARRPGSQPNQR